MKLHVVSVFLDNDRDTARHQRAAADPGTRRPRPYPTRPTAMGIAALLGRSPDIRQGAGSRLRTRLLGTGLVEVGGRGRLVGSGEY